MAQFIVIRLTPATPIDAAKFTNYLAGLTINLYDVSFDHPKAGTAGDTTPAIASAIYHAPNFGPFPVPVGLPFVNYPAGTTIVQHFAPTVALGFVTGIDLKSVATAVFPYAPPAREYPPPPKQAPDLRIQFQRAGAQTVLDPNLYYDVSLYSAGAAPTPDQYETLATSDVSAYVTLPATLDPNLVQLELPTDGRPPNYDDLFKAVNKVLAADPATGQDVVGLVSASGPLTVDQCRNIAYEIIWGNQPPLPAPAQAVESMYTDPPNKGSLTDPNEQSRQQFQGELNSYYATRNANVERLAKFVYALMAAVWCELQSKAATSAVVQFPVNPGATSKLATVSEAEVILTGALGIDIPAEYFYALGAQLPVQVTPAQRLKMACGADQGQNLTQLTSALDAGVINVPPSAPQPSVNPAQAVRILTGLAVPAGPSVTRCPIVAIQPNPPPAAGLWTDWLTYPSTANWPAYQPGDDITNFWPGEVAKVAPIPGAFLELVLYALTQAYIDPATASPLADEIRTNLRVTPAAGPPANVTTVADLSKALASDWQAFFAPPPANAIRVIVKCCG